MKNLSVTNKAFDYVECLRKDDEHEIAVTDIANSMTILANLIQQGRDEEVIGVWQDDLLKVMATIGSYNELLSTIYETFEPKE